ncbi:hypothetical protein HBN50_08500 [Halobacteriovorax sp. GB3]|uniref:hypothetical protein n=1 Tax=Halobacteriovorax sp. GB3 TaxID=2719615 RepID=UPI00235EC417|nr:hypothetical protein [Halobacteriovorax sp. GB3]MDD0853134.1 hypothetical protein [Halobacteriovorax sp. GB3]
MNKQYFLFTFVIFLGLTLNSYAGLFSEKENGDKEVLKSIIKYSRTIDKACPQEDCFVLGIGRSPTPIIDFLRSIDREHITQLPISNFRYNKHNDHIQGRNFGMRLNSSERDRLILHFENHLFHQLSTAIRSGVTKIKVLDFSIRGSSVFSIIGYLKEYLEMSQIDLEIEPMIMTHLNRVETIKETAKLYHVDLDPKKHILADMQDELIIRAFVDSRFDNLAPFLKFDLKVHKKPLENDSKARNAFVSVIEKMAATTQLNEGEKGKCFEK